MKYFYAFFLLFILSCSKDKGMGNVLFQVTGGDGSLNTIYEDNNYTLGTPALLVDGCFITNKAGLPVVDLNITKMYLPHNLDWNTVLTHPLEEATVGIIKFTTTSGRRLELFARRDSISKASSSSIPSDGFFSFKLNGDLSTYRIRVKYYAKD
jgi:hypothetical protein